MEKLIDLESSFIIHRGRGGGFLGAIGNMAGAIKERLTVSGEGRSGEDIILRAKDVDVIEPARRDPAKQGKI